MTKEHYIRKNIEAFDNEEAAQPQRRASQHKALHNSDSGRSQAIAQVRSHRDARLHCGLG